MRGNPLEKLLGRPFACFFWGGFGKGASTQEGGDSNYGQGPLCGPHFRFETIRIVPKQVENFLREQRRVFLHMCEELATGF